MIVGTHVIADVAAASPSMLIDENRLAKALIDACEEVGATVLSHQAHTFPPAPGHSAGGVTVVATLAESHASIHTYPEHGTWMADVFTCGSIDPTRAMELLITLVGGTPTKRVILTRG